MPYLIKEQFNIADIVPVEDKGYVVAMLEPDIYLAKLYERHLGKVGFAVSHCLHQDYLHHHLSVVSPQVLLMNTEIFKKINGAAKAVAEVMLKFPTLRVVTLGFNTSSEDLRELMGAGVVSHINRFSSRPQDVAGVIKAILNY